MIDLSALDRHERIALSFSGGKDSLAVVYLLRNHLDRVTVYHLDTGDLLPEQMEVVRHVERMAPNFVRVETHVNDWIAHHGLPTDLLPHSAHVVGMAMGEGRKLVSRYDCCYANLMLPLWQQVVNDGNTLMIRGTKRADMARLPAESGETHNGVELFYPLLGWSNEQVFAYLDEVGAPISRVYQHVTNSPECARCPAWWGEKRAAYLRQFHPSLFADYALRLRVVSAEITGPLNNLGAELAIVNGAT